MKPHLQPNHEALRSDGWRDVVAAAFEAGCWAVHNNYQPDEYPEFGEAASDYAASVAALPDPPVLLGGGDLSLSQDHAHTHNAAMRASPCTDQGEG